VQNASKATLPESLSGLIERVTFANDDTGFCVLKFKAKGHRDLATVVGALASVSAGEWLTAQGRWVRDREFGLQFRADSGPQRWLSFPRDWVDGPSHLCVRWNTTEGTIYVY